MPMIHTAAERELELMRADAVLPADVEPARAVATSPARTVLLTGATGFVGGHLLHALLRDTTVTVLCVGRANRRGTLAQRIHRNLQCHELWRPTWEQRIFPIDGDLRLPGLGWSERQQHVLAESLDAIYHAGAAVNWVHRYPRLRAANVGGTLELLRLACRTRAKPFHFLSTIGVCSATGTAETMTEDGDPQRLLPQLHLGYAQSKSVADSLVRQARQRGLPAIVYRPGLITGDSQTGAANPHDFLSRGIAGCVRMGHAPDVDWSIDACPVDHVTRVVVQHSLLPVGAGSDVLHLLPPEPRHWRELVLWMSLYGYPLRMIPFTQWLRRLERTARTPEHPLRPLLGFFRARANGASLPESYLIGRRNGIGTEKTSRALAALGIRCPDLDACWLERFFGSLYRCGVLPARTVSRSSRQVPSSEASSRWTEWLTPMFQRSFNDPHLSVHPTGPCERLSRESILTELTSWRCGSAVGLFRQELKLSSPHSDVPATLNVVLKVKTTDRHLLDVAEAAAHLCDRRVGTAFARWRERLGLTGGHRREIALYGQNDERWRRLTPRVYGAAWDEDAGRGLVVMEDLRNNVWMDPCSETLEWKPRHIEAAVRGLAELHAIWFGRAPELTRTSWLGHVLTTRCMAEMIDLWRTLAVHANSFLVPWLGSGISRLQRRLLDRMEHWRSPLEQMPQTLIHNDFNPRNIALREGANTPVLCAFDWELATMGVPQHDLAELLCFVLPYDCSRQSVQHYLNLHRHALEQATGARLSADYWEHGFGICLADLLINRWAMYTLVHAIRPRPFLQRVLRTWQTLYAYHAVVD